MRAVKRVMAVLATMTAVASAIPDHVRAHAVLLDSFPPDNAVLTAPPRQIVLRFNARIEKGVSQATLSAGNSTIPLPSQPTAPKAGPPDRLVIPLPVLKPGSYTLKYRVLATDGHATPGLIRFTISKGAGR